jgi:hypothetical protein
MDSLLATRLDREVLSASPRNAASGFAMKSSFGVHEPPTLQRKV